MYSFTCLIYSLIVNQHDNLISWYNCSTLNMWYKADYRFDIRRFLPVHISLSQSSSAIAIQHGIFQYLFFNAVLQSNLLKIIKPKTKQNNTKPHHPSKRKRNIGLIGWKLLKQLNTHWFNGNCVAKFLHSSECTHFIICPFNKFLPNLICVNCRAMVQKLIHTHYFHELQYMPFHSSADVYLD